MCGNFNQNQNDDFRLPSGAVVTSADEFGLSWKYWGDNTCTDGCGSSCPRCNDEGPARTSCNVIVATDGPFSFCHDEVDPTPYFNDCVFDVCVSGNRAHDILCRAIEAYVSACQSANVRILRWREIATCSKSTLPSIPELLPRHLKQHVLICATRLLLFFQPSPVRPTAIISCVAPTVVTPAPAM